MPDPSTRFPDRVGRFRILGPLGSGGMGTVWRALDDLNQAVVALKILGPEAILRGPDGLERFKREATALSRLPHPNIVRVVEAGQTDEGTSYIALELVEGGPLSERPYGEMPLNRKLEIVRDVARALAHAHANHVVHRDVKPGNILLRGDGTAVLTDFGLARDLARQTKLTQSFALMGTPAYMSPEQAEGVMAAVDPRTDVYSLGVVLYEMISGRLPFPDSIPEDMLERIREDRPPALYAVAPGVPKGVQAVVAKAMEHAPQDRYPDGQALLEDLELLIAGASPRARLIGAAETAWRTLERRPRLRLGIGAVLLLAGLAAFCGGGPSRLTPGKMHKELTSRLDALLDQEAKKPSSQVGRLDVPRLTAALEELERTEPGVAAQTLLGDVETEIDAARLDEEVVAVLDKRGGLVAGTGDSGATESLQKAWRLAGGSTRVVAIAGDTPWIAAVSPLHYPGEEQTLGGWALVGHRLSAQAIGDLARAHEATVEWQVNGVTWSTGSAPGSGSPDDAVGTRRIPGGTERVWFRPILRSPLRVAGLAMAALGAVLLASAFRRRAARARQGP